MKRRGIEKAEEYCDRAADELQFLHQSQTYKERQRHWSSFLGAFSSVYETLKLSARGDTDSERWNAAELEVRKQDDLLTYLFQARNADVHSLQDLTDVASSDIKVGVGRGYHVIDSLVVENGVIKEMKGTTNGGPLSHWASEDLILLRSVTNRGQTYAPPMEHLGRMLIDGSPLEVAEAGLAYITTMTRRAAGLVRD